MNTASSHSQRAKQNYKPDFDQTAYEASCPLGSLVLERGDTIVPTRLHYLWRNVIPLGALTFFVGESGKGKSSFALDVAARVSAGRPWPNAEEDDDRAPKANVFILSGEDDRASIILPKILAARGETGRILFPKGIKRKRGGYAWADLDATFSLLEDSLGGMGVDCPKLILIDPLNDFISPNVDPNKNAQVREGLLALRDFGQRHQVAILAIHHFNKNAKMKARYRLTGSTAFREVARTVYVFEHDDTTDAIFTMRPDKASYLAPEDRIGFDFRIKASEITLGLRRIKTTRVSDIQTVCGQSADAADAERQRTETKTHKAEKWLAAQDFFREGRPISAGKILQSGGNAGFSDRVLRRAAENLAIKMEAEYSKDGRVEGHRWFPPSQ